MITKAKDANMTKFQMTMAAAAASLIAIPMFAASANASVTSQLGNCKYNSKEKTMNCCNQIIRNADRLPMWWPTEQRSCNSAGVVKCNGGSKGKTYALTYVPASKPKCYVEILIDNSNDGSDTPETPTPRQRGGRSFGSALD
jgi:hypothetical protein